MAETDDAPSVPAPSSPSSLGEVLSELYGVLEQRKCDEPDGSYTVKLLFGDQDKLLKKVGEESAEVIIAARDRDASQLCHEIADLVYHLMVVMVREGLTLEGLAAELAERRRA